MFEITIEETFAAGHALRNYHGKCENVHGHNYRVQIVIEGDRDLRAQALVLLAAVVLVATGVHLLASYQSTTFLGDPKFDPDFQALQTRITVGVTPVRGSTNTFTDLVLFSEQTGGLVVDKVPSVPSDPSQGIMHGIAEILAAAGAAPGMVGYVAHGATVATNTLLQRHGARTALITTEGFRDLLEIARQRRPSLYDLHAPKPPALVRRKLRREVPERVTSDGAVRRRLDLDAVDRVLNDLAAEHIEALAVCFLYSFLRPEHERLVVERARERLPEVAVSASSEVLPELREYERLSTTVANAYLLPRMGSYVRAFSRRVAEIGIPRTPYINQSNGGTISIEEAARAPVRTVLSGPSAGVMGAVWLAAELGLGSLVTFDMGGTSTDVSLVSGGQPTLTFEREIGGIPLRVPGLDIHTIGAGGGSVAWRDPGGALRVGPESAGAHPGPACYGLGGSEPTVTDANLVLGYLNPARVYGGSIRLDPAPGNLHAGELHQEGRMSDPRGRGLGRVRAQRRGVGLHVRDLPPAGRRLRHAVLHLLPFPQPEALLGIVRIIVAESVGPVRRDRLGLGVKTPEHRARRTDHNGSEPHVSHERDDRAPSHRAGRHGPGPGALDRRAA